MKMKYELERQKGLCPKCKKPSFRAFKAAKVSSMVGYCSECGYLLSPFEYENIQRILMGEMSDNCFISQRNENVKQTESETIPWVLKGEFITQALSYNTLVKYLKKEVFKGEEEQKDIILAAARYGLETQRNPGHTWHGAPVFYQFDLEYRKVSYKIIQYDENGHRVKGVDYGRQTDRAERVDRGTPENELRNQDIPKDLLNQQSLIKKGEYCLFGLHLLNHPDVKNKKICIVESEKTAIICSIAYPEGIWLAAGSCYYLSEKKMKDIYSNKCILRKNIILFPDTDVYNEKRDEKLGESDWFSMPKNQEWLKGVHVSMFTLNKYAKNESGKYVKDKDGHDMADYILDCLKNNNELAPFKDIIQ